LIRGETDRVPCFGHLQVQPRTGIVERAEMPASPVVVLGAGPAGSATALALCRRGVPVTIIDPGVRVNGAWKIGESLPPTARPLLDRLGVWRAFVDQAHAPCFGNRSAWGSPNVQESVSMFDPYGPSWRLDRARFDAMLLKAAIAAGARLLRAAIPVGGYTRRHDGEWSLELNVDEQRCALHTQFVVDATGRASAFARRQGARRLRIDRAVSVSAVLTAPRGAGLVDSTTLVEAVRDGWWYSSVLDDQRVLVSYTTDSDLLVPKSAWTSDGWLELVRRAEHTWSRIRSGGYRAETQPWLRPASSACLAPTAGSNWVAAGDSAASHDPLSSHGVSAALRSGWMVGEAVSAAIRGNSGLLRAYDRFAAHLYLRYLVRRHAYYALEQRWPNAPFWQRRSTVPVRAARGLSSRSGQHDGS
jgi:flavin-dependent dehydrogenase